MGMGPASVGLGVLGQFAQSQGTSAGTQALQDASAQESRLQQGYNNQANNNTMATLPKVGVSGLAQTQAQDAGATQKAEQTQGNNAIQSFVAANGGGGTPTGGSPTGEQQALANSAQATGQAQIGKAGTAANLAAIQPAFWTANNALTDSARKNQVLGDFAAHQYQTVYPYEQQVAATHGGLARSLGSMMGATSQASLINQMFTPATNASAAPVPGVIDDATI